MVRDALTKDTVFTDGEANPLQNAAAAEMEPVTIQRIMDIDEKDLENPYSCIPIKMNNEFFVFCDSYSLNALHSPRAKQVAWAERYSMGIPGAGIEHYGGPSPVTEHDRVKSRLQVTPETPTVYRQMFKMPVGL